MIRIKLSGALVLRGMSATPTAGFDQCDQVGFGGCLMAAVEIEILAPQDLEQRRRGLAKASHHQSLLAKIVKGDDGELARRCMLPTTS